MNIKILYNIELLNNVYALCRINMKVNSFNIMHFIEFISFLWILVVNNRKFEYRTKQVLI